MQNVRSRPARGSMKNATSTRAAIVPLARAGGIGGAGPRAGGPNLDQGSIPAYVDRTSSRRYSRCVRFPSALGLLSAFTLSSACTDVSLYGKVGQEPELADKVALTGVLCTDNPATRKFPVKILFVVDA